MPGDREKKEKTMIYIHLAEGFEEMEAVVPADVLRRAGLDVKLVSVTGNRKVTGAHGIALEADLLFEEADYGACRMIVLPGGMPGMANLESHGGLQKQLEAFVREGKYAAAICAAPMIFARRGYLKGKKAVIYPGMEEHLTAGGAEPSKDAAVREGNLVTGRGPGAAFDFALKLAEVLKGKEAVRELEKELAR